MFHDKPWTQRVAELYRTSSSSMQASGFFSGTKIDAARAAFVNGVACGSLDWDDSHVAAILHPGIVVWPAALAMAEVVGATGKELLTAAVAGYEVAIRVGMSVQPEHSLRGFQGTPACGIFGAAAASARLLKLDVEGTRNALGIAATFACGIAQFFLSGSDIKRFHAGKAAANGVEAALLARSGLSGPHDAIEGRQGFGRAFSDRFDPRVAVRDLGTRYQTAAVSLKPHASSVRVQAAIEAAESLAREGLEAEAIKTIEVGVHPAMMGKLTKSDPGDHQQTQCSVPFAVAMAIILTPTRAAPLVLSVDDFAASLADERIRLLSLRTTCVPDREVEARTSGESVPARVTCTLGDESTREKFVEYPKGSPQNPLTQDEVVARFRTIARGRFGGDAIESWLETVRKVDQLQNISALFALRPAAE